MSDAAAPDRREQHLDVVLAGRGRHARDAGFEPSVPAEYDPRIYEHQLPGGMTGTLISQLQHL